MNSTLTLSLNKTNLKNQYLDKRNQEMFKISLIFFIVNFLFTLAMNIMAGLMIRDPYIAVFAMPKLAALMVHFIMLILSRKYPR